MKNILIWLVAVVVSVALWLVIPDAVLKYLFFVRVPLIMGIFLVLIPYFAQNQLSAMLKNLFILRNKWQLTSVIVGAIMTGMAIALGFNAILLNASDRFDLPTQIDIPESVQYALAIALGLPVCLTVYKLAQKNTERIGLSDRKISVILGTIISIMLLIILDFTRNWLFNNEVIKNIILQVISFFAKQHLDGYINQNGELARGHLTAIAFLITAGISYLAIGLIFNPKAQSRRPEAPALLYVLLLIGMLSLLFGGTTFYLDYFRIPVIVSFILLSVIAYLLFDVDHFFHMGKVAEADQVKADYGDFHQVLDARLHHQNGERTLVIVCASGGGIQASGWTVQVLIGLQKVLSKSFTKSIGFISGVSGGSVGTMYYLDRFESNSGCPENGDINIFKSATSDSLDAVGWGFAYLDLWRFIGLPFLINPNYDRGTAMEKDWEGEMKSPNSIATLNTWRDRIFKGEIPVPIFNATIVENGQRFLISPMTFNQIANPNYRDFNSLYPNYDISVVTAARLSATFPYVSPICRPKLKGSETDIENKKYHFADGGYFDNSGFATMAEWLDEWLQPEKKLNIKRVLILQINPFPKAISESKGKGDKGWFMATIGPLLTMYKVRDTILAERNEMEAKLLIEKWQNQAESDRVEIVYHPIFFPSSSELKEASKTYLEDSNVDISEFFDRNGEYQPPLSWKLSDGQKKAIQAGWEAIANPNATIKSAKVIQDLKQLWHETWQMPQDI
ncbi:patatin-like phospholipase family protein [Merismopedia glauca]|uniref:PNPLA domain-containing protein n=1 Tax=Merismopedia glauca CCAP 1448/3 TaxID=1296344 RepID=A0A2T1BXH7_9CYAN|nr:patatin-like phospholipase family protein [Merismopedia glauca]PSB00658.1 hypothetical protein C7B64_22380 [Merismopedia glauca CCAP 1448/3]